MDESIGIEKYRTLTIQDITVSASASNSDLEVLAFVVRSGDLILYGLRHEETDPIIRWIPWFDDVEKKLCAIAFNPDGGEGLLLACYDQTFYIVPTLALLTIPKSGEEENRRCDVLKLPNPFVAGDGFIPSAIAWWVRQATGDSTRHSAIVGSTNGQIVVFSIYTGAVLFTTLVEGVISSIEVFSKPELSYIVVSNNIGKQWRITLLESLHQVGTKTPDNSLEKKFSSLSINVVDSKGDARPKKQKNLSSPLRVEFIAEERIFCKQDVKLHITMHSVGEQMLHVNCNSIITTYSSSFVTVEKSTLEQVLVHKLPEKTQFFALTNSFFFSHCENSNSILIISRNLTLNKTDASRHLFNTEFNKDAIIIKMTLRVNERLLNIFSSSYHDHGFVITSMGIYVIRMKKDPQDLALSSILANSDLHEAEKLSIIFGLDLQRLICQAAGVKLAQGLLEEAKHLYSLSPTGSIHQVMMLAITGYFRELLDVLQACKFASSNKVQFTNLKLLLYIHQILLSKEDMELVFDFRDVLLSEEYDEAQAMRILCQVFMFSELHFIMKMKGMHQSVLPALMTLVPTLDLTQLKGFWELISDPGLTETLITRQAFASFHANMVLKYLHSLPNAILLNLEKLYNPYQTTVRNFMSNICKGDLPKKLWVETYLSICICLSSSMNEYDEETLAMTSYGHVWEVEQPRVPYVRGIISAGFRHAAVILKGIAYGWGWSTHGSLGFGPTSQPVGGPKAVDTLMNLKKTVISISCGRYHTIALTNDGVYTWGSNRFGQLGTGNTVQAWFPTRIEILSSFRVVSVTAGQYHSMALDDMNRVFSWGWGVHGQLGHGSVDDIYRPKIVTFLSDKGIINFSAGQGHSLFLDKDGRVWACGNNTFGQLGIGEMKKSSTPVQVYGFTQRMIFIDAGYFQNCAMSHDGKLFQWGRSPTVLRSAAHSAKRRVRLEECAREQFMMEDGAEHMTPKLVDTSAVQGHIIKVSVGSDHSIAITENGCVYAWGRNIDGQLGILATLAERRTQYIPAPVSVPIDAKIINVACGWNFTIALDDSEKVWTWGAIHPFKGTRGTKLAGLEGEIVVVNNKNRVIKLPHANTNVHPVPTILTINHQNKEQEMFSPAKLPSALINSQWRMRMHFTLEQLSNDYDSTQAIKKCLSINEHDACSKLAFLSGDYATSVYEKLVSTNFDSDRISVVNYYLTHDFPDEDVLRKMLAQIIGYWRKINASITLLEDVFLLHDSKIAKSLGMLLFGTTSSGNDCTNLFSTEFKVRILKKMISTSADNYECIFDGFNNTDDVIRALENADEFIDINFIQIKDAASTSKERRFFSL